MSKALKAIFATLDQLFASCEIDYGLLKDQKMSTAWLGDYSNQRIVNSFLFNYIKIQDKLGALCAVLSSLKACSHISSNTPG
jgi:hypothetical protein